MIERIAASLIRRLDLPFQRVDRRKHTDPDVRAVAEMKEKLCGVPRFIPGRVSVGGWILSYVDAPSLISCFEATMVNRWNDFVALREDPIILDCGANVGVTVLRYKRLYPKARITAFEPDHQICDVLRQNLAANGVHDVEVVESALWTAVGRNTFFAQGADGGRLIPATETDDTWQAGRIQMVNTVRLADYIARGSVDFIKLDIEGAEFEVLPDCADYLCHVQSMAMEFHLMNNSPQKLGPAFKALTDAGFSLSVNSTGSWVDLLHPPARKPHGDFTSDQYLMVHAWRPEA